MLFLNVITGAVFIVGTKARQVHCKQYARNIGRGPMSPVADLK